MKSNPTLQASLNFINNAQIVAYCAHVLQSHLIASPAATIQKAVAAKPEILAQTAKPARAASVAVSAIANTVGYGFGELYLNSPAYPIGVAIPAIPAKPASAAVIGVPAVVALPEIKVAAVPALKGWEDSITIAKSIDTIIINAELPTVSSVRSIGSDKVIIGEITSPAAQAKLWIDEKASNLSGIIENDATTLTLEALFYKYALQCEHTLVDAVKVVNGVDVAVKSIEVTLYAQAGFDPDSDLLQLPKITVAANAGS